MYTQYFGFQEPPFKITPDSGFFYTNGVFLDAHSRLLDAIDEQRGLNLLIGEPGTGKTTLLKRLAEDLDETVRFIHLQNSNLKPEDLIGSLLGKLSIVKSGEAREPLEVEVSRLRDYLRRLTNQQQSCVVCIDDAQNLPSDTLNILPLLLHGENGESLAQIVLSGAPELPIKLTDPAHSAVLGLVTVRAQLDRLSASEIPAFIDHQIRVAGSMRSDIFSESAIREITQTTSGRPSDINQVCDKALEIAYRQKTQVVTREIVRQANSPSWLDIEEPFSNSRPKTAVIKNLITKAVENIPGSRAPKQPAVPDATQLAPRQPASRIKLWLASAVRSFSAVRSLSRKRVTFARELTAAGQKIVERTDILALVATAKAWKTMARASLIWKRLAINKLPGGWNRWRDANFEFRRRHAWMVGGLAVIAAVVGVLAYTPDQTSEQIVQRDINDEAPDLVATARDGQTSANLPSGRQLSEISSLRAELAQRNLDLKTSVSNRNYLQKRIAALTKERDSLTIENAQMKFATDQLELTLAATRKQLADVTNELSTTQALARLNKEQIEDDSSSDISKPKAQENATAERSTISDANGASYKVASLGSQNSLATGAELNAAAPEPTLNVQTEVVSLDPAASNTRLEYIGDDTEPIISQTNTSLAANEETPIIAGIPQFTDSVPEEVIEASSIKAPPADDHLKAPKKTFSDHTVALLLYKARRLYLKDKLTTPTGDNAYDVYQQILEGNPGHPKAIAGIRKIAGRYLDWARAEEDRGNKRKALRYYRKALSVQPQDKDIATQIATLENGRSVQAPAASVSDPLPGAPKPDNVQEASQAAPDLRQSEAARNRLKTLRIEVSERSLLRAVEAGNLEIADLLMDAGVSPNAQNTSRQTALLTAAINGNAIITRRLLERGADANKTNNMGRSPLLAAAWNGNAPLVSVLLEGGAEIDATSNEGWNALMYAAWNGHGTTVRTLLKRGVRIDAVNAQGWTALMNAAWNGHSETVRLLLEHGANPGHVTPTGETALLVASQQGHRETALLLE